MTLRISRPAIGTVSTVLTVLTVLTLAGACTSFGSADGDEPDTATEVEVVAVPSVAVPAERLAPFCQAMIDLGDELVNDPPDDEGARIIEVYEGIVDDVPDEIRTDFTAVLDRLRSGAPATTSAPPTTPVTTPPTTPADSAPGAATGTAPVFDEGYTPDDDPALRLNAYIQSTCRSTQNNPGPAATQPGVTIPDE